MRPQIVSSEATTTANDTGGGSALALAQDENESYMRYEFSETRKVLDEFFHKDPAENDRTEFLSLFFSVLVLSKGGLISQGLFTSVPFPKYCVKLLCIKVQMKSSGIVISQIL